MTCGPWIFFQESAASASDLSEPECEPSSLSSATPTAKPSSPSAGLMSPATETFAAFTLPLDLPTSSLADFPVPTFPPQAQKPALTVTPADYGESSGESLATLDHDGSSWRTSQRCFIDGSEKFSETWPRSGMTRNGTAYRLPTLALPLTERGGTECGLWPTPTTGDCVGRGYHGNLRGNWWAALPGAIALSLGYPVQHPITAQINPQFLEWLMGFPIGHTELPPSETRYARRSSKSSGGRSSKRSE